MPAPIGLTWSDLACGNWQNVLREALTASGKQTVLSSLSATAHACICSCGAQPLTKMVNLDTNSQHSANCNLCRG